MHIFGVGANCAWPARCESENKGAKKKKGGNFTFFFLFPRCVVRDGKSPGYFPTNMLFVRRDVKALKK